MIPKFLELSFTENFLLFLLFPGSGAEAKRSVGGTFSGSAGRDEREVPQRHGERGRRSTGDPR